MKCPYCGKELDRILLTQWREYEEANMYTLSPDGTIGYKIKTIGRKMIDSSDDGLQCSYCKKSLRWTERDGKIIILK